MSGASSGSCAAGSSELERLIAWNNIARPGYDGTWCGMIMYPHPTVPRLPNGEYVMVPAGFTQQQFNDWVLHAWQISTMEPHFPRTSGTASRGAWSPYLGLGLAHYAYIARRPKREWRHMNAYSQSKHSRRRTQEHSAGVDSDRLALANNSYVNEFLDRVQETIKAESGDRRGRASQQQRGTDRHRRRGRASQQESGSTVALLLR